MKKELSPAGPPFWRHFGARQFGGEAGTGLHFFALFFVMIVRKYFFQNLPLMIIIKKSHPDNYTTCFFFGRILKWAYPVFELTTTPSEH